MTTVYKNRYQAVKNRTGFETMTVKVDGGYINLSYSDWKLWKRTK